MQIPREMSAIHRQLSVLNRPRRDVAIAPAMNQNMVTGRAEKKPANWIESRGVRVQPKPSPLHCPSGSEPGASNHAMMSPKTPTSHATVMTMNARLAVRRAFARCGVDMQRLYPGCFRDGGPR